MRNEKAYFLKGRGGGGRCQLNGSLLFLFVLAKIWVEEINNHGRILKKIIHFLGNFKMMDFQPFLNTFIFFKYHYERTCI